MSQNTVRRVAIIGGNRIPFARSNGAYFTASNTDMFTAALNGLVERFNLQGQRLGEVVAGAVLKHSRDFNMTRECVLNTALAPETPAYDIQQACGTGLQAAFLVANKIALGQIEVGIAGGVDTTSDAPIAFGDGLRKALLELNIAKTAKDRLKALTKINVKDLMDAPKMVNRVQVCLWVIIRRLPHWNGEFPVKRKMNWLHLHTRKWLQLMKKVSLMT